MRTNPLQSLLRQARRRWAGWRCAEAAGIGSAVGAGCAGVLALVAAGATQEIGQGAFVLLPLGGAVLGVALRARSLPSLTESAAELDRQFDLDDLLTTAATMDTTDAFADAVRAQAGARAGEVRVSSMIVRRIGPRGWSVIATVLLALPIIVLLTSDSLTLARADQGSVSEVGGPTSTSDRQHRPGSTDNQNAGSADMSREGRDGESRDARPDRSTPGDSARGNHPTQGDAARSTPGGIGAIIARRMGGTVETPTGESIGRAGGIADRPRAADAPWTGNDWSIAREQAGRAIRAQRVPADTRDVVRRYFNADD